MTVLGRAEDRGSSTAHFGTSAALGNNVLKADELFGRELVTAQ